MNKQENLLKAFRHFDTDNSGTISRQELKDALAVGGAGRLPGYCCCARLPAFLSVLLAYSRV